MDISTLILLSIPVIAALVVILDDGVMHTHVKSQKA